MSSLVEDIDDKLFEYVLTNQEHYQNMIVDMNSHTVCALGMDHA